MFIFNSLFLFSDSDILRYVRPYRLEALPPRLFRCNKVLMYVA